MSIYDKLNEHRRYVRELEMYKSKKRSLAVKRMKQKTQTEICIPITCEHQCWDREKEKQNSRLRMWH